MLCLCRFCCWYLSTCVLFSFISCLFDFASVSIFNFVLIVDILFLFLLMHFFFIFSFILNRIMLIVLYVFIYSSSSSSSSSSSYSSSSLFFFFVFLFFFLLFFLFIFLLLVLILFSCFFFFFSFSSFSFSCLPYSSFLHSFFLLVPTFLTISFQYLYCFLKMTSRIFISNILDFLKSYLTHYVSLNELPSSVDYHCTDLTQVWTVSLSGINIIRMVTLKEGTSQNVPIAGFDMILREDYKSRRLSRGAYNLPEISFQIPRYCPNILWWSRQESRHLLYYMAPHCLARLLHNL